VSGERGQAAVLLLGALLAMLVGAVILGGVARGIGEAGGRQRAADLAALAGAARMRGDYARLFEPARIDGRPNPRALGEGAYLARARAAAVTIGRRNGARRVTVRFPDAASFAPVRIRVLVRDPVRVTTGSRPRTLAVRRAAEAELSPPGGGIDGRLGVGEYHGSLARRQGKPMRPDVARWFDRMAAAAARDGVHLVIASAFRSNAEQAVLFARHPDPKWVARPGRSLHRLGTELDLGPASAYGWLARNARRFHFAQRYAWERWHYGFTLNAGTASVGFGPGDGREGATLPTFVPARYAPVIAKAASRWNVSGALLAAQLYAESGFNPFAVSSAGAQGIAQFMPGTARSLGLRNPWNATASIGAQARLMRDLLRRFGAVPLALAAYNAGEGAVAACGCIPDNGETMGYVARILGLLRGAGEATPGLRVRLVR
jgi:hypothetical protein